jgi:hypothetical protein
MAEKKITKREKFEMLRALVEDNDMLVEFIDHEIELLSRKGSKSATLTPAQKDALAVAEIIKDILSECSDEKGMTVGALLKCEPIATYVKADGNSVSSQMITAIFTKNAKDYVRTVEKKVAYYALAYGVDDEDEVAEGV